MEPLSIFGLAVNVLQLIDFSAKLLREAHELHHSSTGNKQQHVELQVIADDLSRLCDDVASQQDGSNAGMQGIATTAKGVADDLVAAIEKLKLKTKPRTRWRSFRQALSTLWNSATIDALQHRLKELRDQMQTNMVSQINFKQERLVKSLDALRVAFEQMNCSRTQNVHTLTSQADSVVLTALNPASLQAIEDTFARIEEKKTKFLEEKSVLDSLSFDAMHDRYHAIKDAHTETFEWIFEPSRFQTTDLRSTTGFKDWLRSSDSIFWVSGKPGSGKSTLMKFLRDCPQTETRLREWADRSKLVIAAFYFWRSGTELQCSQRGLLRQLLYEILRVSPETMSALGLIQSSSLSRPGDIRVWTLPRLRDVFTRLRTTGIHAKLCLFIDGLDEYKGEHLDLIEIVRSLASVPWIKLCISSRRWPCFEDALGGNPKRKIYLEELTREDIYRFANSRLSDIRRTEIGPPDDQQYLSLVSQITSKAEGVFLWVFLVVRSLRDGLVNGDSVEILQQRLDELPSDLELFFEAIFNSVDRVYRTPMAVTFRVALQAPFPMTLVTYWFLDEQHSSEKVRWAQDYGRSEEGINALELDMRRRLYGRYKGLLEATGSTGTQKVDFLHRTVRDFLQTSAAGDAFLIQGLQPYTKCCRALLGVMPLYAAPVYDTEGADQTYRYIKLFVVFAKWAEIHDEQQLDLSLVSKMSQACKKFNDEGEYKNGFLGTIIQYGFVSGLRHLRSVNRRLIDTHGLKMLRAALKPQKPLARDSFGIQPAIDTLDWLLMQGARRYAQDVFPQLLVSGFLGLRPGSDTQKDDTMPYDHWKPSVDLLIRHGADVTKALVDAANSASQIVRVTLFIVTGDDAVRLKHEEKFRSSTVRAFDRLIETWTTFIEGGINLNVQIGDSTLWQILLNSLAWIITIQNEGCILEDHCAQLMTLFIDNGANPYLKSSRLAVQSVSDLLAQISDPQRKDILQKALRDAEGRWNRRYPRQTADPSIEGKSPGNKRRPKQAPTPSARPRSFATSGKLWTTRTFVKRSKRSSYDRWSPIPRASLS